MEDNQVTEFQKATVFSPQNTIEYAEGAIVSKQINKQKNGNITLFAFDKGQGLTEHIAAFDAVIQIIDGTAEIFINKQPHLLQQGEMIIMPANISHAVFAPKRFKMMLIMIKEDV